MIFDTKVIELCRERRGAIVPSFIVLFVANFFSYIKSAVRNHRTEYR